MHNNDFVTREEARINLMQALKDNDQEAFAAAFNDMIGAIGVEIEQKYQNSINDLREELDSKVLTARGVRQLTTAEKTYYQKLSVALKSANPKQALEDTDLVMPETVINSVFDDLSTNHPLLSAINFRQTAGNISMLLNTNGYQEAQWGKLCDDIVKELLSGFREVNMGLLKLSAFLPVCKATLELGPEWLDSYIREVLYEALANGLEFGIVAGDGNDQPIGMNRQVGENVTVTGGRYPIKGKISLNDLTPATIGNLLSIVAADPNGKPRVVREVIFVVNPQDYFQKVMPATTIMAPDGTYRNNVMPYPMTIIQSSALDRGDAILGLGYKYFAGAGMQRNGRIEQSDHYRFLEDERVYLIKLYANGFPVDNNAFLHLDISGLRPAVFRFEQVTGPEASTDANLADLRVGNLAIEFDPATTEYTLNTTNATNVVTAVPADAGAYIEVMVGEDEIDNGSAATWAEGANTVKITVTAADGTTEKTYTVTVNKA